MRVYEELFIVKPDAPEEEVESFIEQVKQVIVSGKGTVDKADKWGTRKLAYRIQKYNEGLYILFQFTSSPELVKEVERRLRVTDMVIKFITVRIDEKQKKIEKRKKAREKRSARRPPPMMAQPQAAPAMPAEPAAVPGLPGHAAPAAPAAVHPAPAAPAAAAHPAPAASHPVPATPVPAKETPQE
jgi:small subunit ribosomal protein S6